MLWLFTSRRRTKFASCAKPGGLSRGASGDARGGASRRHDCRTGSDRRNGDPRSQGRAVVSELSEQQAGRDPRSRRRSTLRSTTNWCMGSPAASASSKKATSSAWTVGCIYEGFVGDAAFHDGRRRDHADGAALARRDRTGADVGIKASVLGNETMRRVAGDSAFCRKSRLQRRARIYRARRWAGDARRTAGSELVAASRPPARLEQLSAPSRA